jgi:cytoskeletal protein CcmA (bactofilin family)
MFEKSKDVQSDEAPDIQISETRSERPPGGDFNARSAAVIGTTIKIKGKVTGEENLVIEGQVDGSVDLPGHDLTVGQKGQVKADLRARTVKAEGQITGDITGSEKVVLTNAGRVLGNITAPRVTLEDGAKFKGSIDMDPGLEATEKTTPAKTTPSKTVSSPSSGTKRAPSPIEKSA